MWENFPYPFENNEEKETTNVMEENTSEVPVQNETEKGKEADSFENQSSEKNEG